LDIHIRNKVKSMIRIRIKRVWIRNTARGWETASIFARAGSCPA
jgi:hypothetical protein